jgi:hypothetical protein
MADPLPAPRWSVWAVRLVGLWILAGGLLKLFLGSPADLPDVLRHVPLPLLRVFQGAIAIEIFVGLFAILVPSRGWPLALLLLITFASLLGVMLADGAKSCGCFGKSIQFPPAVALAIDGGLLLLLLAARPWRLARPGTWAIGAALAALAVGVAMPLYFLRPEGSNLVSFDLRSWVGKSLKETPIAPWLGEEEPRDGLWFFYRTGCEICGDCLKRMPLVERGEREVTLVHLAEPEDPDHPVKAHVLPSAPNFHHIEFPPTMEWYVTPPAEVVVQDGKVVSFREGLGAEDCK